MKKTLLLILLSGFAAYSIAQAPAGYYDSIDQKKKDGLKTALHQILKSHVSLGYDSNTAQYWGDVYFKQTDWNSSGYYWDMYSPNQETTYNSSSMAREHCLPRSWWQDKGGDGYGFANSDILNLYPANSEANGKKSNWPLGELGTITYDNGVAKVGQNTYGSEYNGTAFEPADEYKGDFARTYFYMVTCYEDYAGRWNGDGLKMLDNNAYPVFKDWALSMLLKWHRDDPVSPKEVERNNAVFGLQFNRNPYIDYPELVEYIWGNNADNTYAVTNKATLPALLTPTSTTALDFGVKSQTIYPSTKDILVRGVLLTQPIQATIVSDASNAYSVSVSNVDPADANAGFVLTVNFVVSTEAVHTAVLRLNSSEIGTLDIPLTGEYKKNVSVEPCTPSDDMDVMFFHKDAWNKIDLPFGFTSNSTDTYLSGTILGLKSTGKNLVVQFTEEPDLLQFAIKPYNAWGANDNHLYVYESIDAASWGSPIEDFNNQTGTLGTSTNYYNTPEIQLSGTTRAIKIEYSKTAQNVGINNLIISRRQGVDIFENFVDNNNGVVYVSENKLFVNNVDAGEAIYIYNLQGRQIYSGKTVSGENSIDLTEQGIFIVRVAGKAYKVIN